MLALPNDEAQNLQIHFYEMASTQYVELHFWIISLKNPVTCVPTD